MELQDYLRILRKNWILILLLTLVGAGIGGAVSLVTSPKYSSTAELYVTVRAQEGAATGDLLQGTNFARQSVVSYVDVATSALVLDRVIDRLDLDNTASELESKLSVTAPEGTVLIKITATDVDPQHAAELADAVGEDLTTVIEDVIELADSDGQSRVQLSVINPATVAENPVSPNTKLNIALGTVLGLMIGFGLALLRHILDTRIRSLHDIRALVEAPVIGGIAYDSDFRKQPLIVQAKPRSPLAEAFRALRTNVQFLDPDSTSQVFVLTSASPAEGKSTTSTNLAIALAQTGFSVALVDADLRKPKVAEYMGIEGSVGLTDVLIGKAELTDVLQPWGRGRLAVLPAGRIPPNPSELLGSRAMQEVIANLGENVDYVIIDSPPVLPVTDATVISRFANGIILTVAAGSTKRQQLASAVDAIDAAEGKLLGIVATMLPTKGPDSNAYGAYSYGESYGVYGDEVVPDKGAIAKATAKKAKTAESK
ncbi:polysaccharide biosynthesis tyrosine autokinase [Gulosibacter chungangensis]|uniref:non-specific protein-tyrosine kinase n=1 Tax=Gulosibacter chungangensis TaxID=979746 RepID=A0A7J5B9J7_9MICO|nr:polysaccharide biosynthesis tyrosine autokinase [Gulosibacter chungangensis]KAB1641705.1 polysaccharide biosynthesis tyrosine autokinase [Gulosibacter chungangensis]